MEKTFGACSALRMWSKRVPPYALPWARPVIPSATWLRNKPDSYVWQPNGARTAFYWPLDEPNQNLSYIMRPRMDEPSVYETE